MNVYASTNDLTDGGWLTTAPSNVAGLLRSATFLVAVATNRNPYTDPAPGLDEANALRDATCAQAAAWVTAGIDPTAGAAGEQAPVKRSTLLGDSLEYDTTATATARAEAAASLCAEAVAILRMTGLLYIPVPSFDDTGSLDTWGLDIPYCRTVPIDSEDQRNVMDAGDYDGDILDGGNPFNEIGT